MSGTEVLWLVVGVLVVLALLGVALVVARKKKRTATLQGRYGPEYDRTVESAGKRSEAERVLQERLDRREQLEIRPLSATSRERYLSEWTRCQARFVDDPVGSVTDADDLLDRVLRERGYPADDFSSKADMVAVDHPEVVHHYRGAHEVTDRGQVGQATTEELREAFVHYRSLFDRLLDGGADASSAASSAVPADHSAPVYPPASSSGRDGDGRSDGHLERDASWDRSPDRDGDGRPDGYLGDDRRDGYRDSGGARRIEGGLLSDRDGDGRSDGHRPSGRDDAVPDSAGTRLVREPLSEDGSPYPEESRTRRDAPRS